MKTRRLILPFAFSIIAPVAATGFTADGRRDVLHTEHGTIRTDSVKPPIRPSFTDSVGPERRLGDAQVVARRRSVSRLGGAENAMLIGRQELFKAACCNLGESFVTNPSVDVSYDDATTGARQIRLLGLSGSYVQLLAEALPDFRGAASPYSLGYIPGPWMKSIQVSKGAASVKNGYESITGQINVEYKKPEDEQGAEVNLYGSSMGRFEANTDANLHVSPNVDGEVLLHYEKAFADHDANHDGFTDRPRVAQWHVQNRWVWRQGPHIFHAGVTALKEQRRSGQMDDAAPGMTGTAYGNDHMAVTGSAAPYRIRLDAERYGAYAKQAFFLDTERGTNVALMASADMHRLDAAYGMKAYDVNEKNVYAALMFETNMATVHNLSAGFNLVYDYLGQRLRREADAAQPLLPLRERETTPGAYAQYTLTLGSRLTAMAGLRADHSSRYGWFVTPRFHVKYAPSTAFSLRASAGKGYRTVHAWAENNYLLASSRRVDVGPLAQEAAWNYGASAALALPLGAHVLKVNAEYYHTRFLRQTVTDYDADPGRIIIANLTGRSYSHTLQLDASYPVVSGLEMTAAWRWTDVRTTTGGRLRRKPLTSRYKALLTASYKTPLGLWQADATLQVNGPGRMPDAFTLTDGTPSWNNRFPAYARLDAQLTRWFRHWAIYVGGENLTGYRQSRTIIGAANPWGPDFEPTLIWGPVDGVMVYAGIRLNILRNSF